MKRVLLTLLLATLCAATSYGQTIKSLGYNSTNGQVVANTGTNVLTFTNAVSTPSINYGGKPVFSAEENAIFNIDSLAGDSVAQWETNFWRFRVPVEFVTNYVATTRTNLGLPLAALTNTSNVTMMRALAGITNTNTPASGTYQITNIISISISNGIILEVEEP